VLAWGRGRFKRASPLSADMRSPALSDPVSFIVSSHLHDGIVQPVLLAYSVTR